MRVLGISPLDKDATASFMEDGHVVFACAEERLSRVKLQDGFPYRAVQLGLERTGWDLASIDKVAYAFFDGETEAKLMRDALREDAEVHRPNCTAKSIERLRAVSSNGYAVDRSIRIPTITDERSEFMAPKSLWKRMIYKGLASHSRLDWTTHRRVFKRWVSGSSADHIHWTGELDKGLAKLGLSGKLQRFHHHDTHAANAYYASGYDEALLVTFDGYGSGCCGGIYVGDAKGIHLLHRFPFPNSLGHFYEHVTSGLGFRPMRHEGKIVGLAAYGDSAHLREVLLSRFECADGDIRIRAGLNHMFVRALADRFAKRDIAAAYQDVLEEVARTTVAYWVAKTGQRNIAVSGGVHANVKLNQRLREIDGVESVFVYPNMGDGGCATGAAMLAFAAGIPDGKPIDNVYYGPEYSDTQLRAALDKAGLSYSQPDEVENEIAQLIADNQIIGRFSGRMEYGPRALGNRSILYPARDPEVNQWLNQQLGRTEFMPFAPAALASEANHLFHNLDGCEKTAEFMTITFDCTQEMISMCPAAVHVDGTARPQLVSEHTNPSFHKILETYYQKTGIPAIINTSFNMHEEPIVCTPHDAVRAFLKGNLDYLAIGSFLAEHPRRKENAQDRRQAYAEA